jgi:hypothetical protein
MGERFLTHRSMFGEGWTAIYPPGTDAPGYKLFVNQRITIHLMRINGFTNGL